MSSEELLNILFNKSQNYKKLKIYCAKARFKRRFIHAPNLTDELSTAEERRLNQFGSADYIWSGKEH